MASNLGPGVPGNGAPSQRAMGIGQLGSPTLVFKRKFRWTFSVELNCPSAPVKSIGESFVKLAARPNLSVEEVELNFLNAKTWIPGKGSWETITVTYMDVAGRAKGSDSGSTTNIPNQGLWNWIASVYDFTKPDTLHQGSQRQDYTATGTLYLWDGCGQPLEMWTMQDMWPTSIQFGDLDYTSSDTVDIELTLRYSEVSFTNFCPGFGITACCSPCS